MVRTASIKVPAALESLGLVREFLEEAASVVGLDREAAFALILATDEAFDNLIRHGDLDTIGQPVVVDFGFDDDEATVTIVDQGRPFDPEDRPRVDVSQVSIDSTPGGLGWLLITKSVDSFDYFAGPGGNRLILRKKQTSRGNR